MGLQLPSLIAAALREALLGRISVNRDLLHLQMSAFVRNISDNAQNPDFYVIQSRKSKVEQVAVVPLGYCTCMLTGM